MSAPRPAARFVVTFAAAYAVLLALSGPLGGAHASATRAAWNAVARAFGGALEPGIAIRFDAAPPGPGGTESVMSLSRARTGFDMRFEYGSRPFAYWPTAIMAALALATPAGWPRRLRALVLGVLAVQAFAALGALAFVADAFRRFDPVSAAREAAWWQSALSHFVDRILPAPLLFTLVPLGLWAILGFRCGDWGVNASKGALA